MMKTWLYILLVLVAFASCTKQDRENAMADEEKRIDSYISSVSSIRVQRNMGVNRVVLREGVGIDTLSVGDSVKLYYSGYEFHRTKSRLFVTNVDSVANANNFLCMKSPLCIKLEKGSVIDGLFYGLQGMRVGEKSELVFTAKYGYGNTIVYNIPKLTSLIFEVEIVDIIKN